MERLAREDRHCLDVEASRPTGPRLNVVLLIGSANLLEAVKDLADNYNDERGSPEKQIPILNRIMLGMRRDLDDAESKHLAEFQFPIIFPDIEPSAKALRLKQLCLTADALRRCGGVTMPGALRLLGFAPGKVAG